MQLITGRTADELWRRAWQSIRLGHGHWVGGRGGRVAELLHVAMVLENPRERWVASRLPAMNPAFALAEVLWILLGRDDLAFLEKWNPILHRFVGADPKVHGAYGARLRQRFGLDQIKRAYEIFSHKPDTRQVVLQIWDAPSDLPLNNGEPRGPDIPCNVCSILKVRQGALHWTQIMRSNDLVLGWPHNVVQFTCLQEMMAGWLGLRLGPYTHISDSLHVYEQQLEGMAESLVPALPEADPDMRWRMGCEETMTVLAEAARLLETDNPGALAGLLGGYRWGSPARDWLIILAADLLRRAETLSPGAMDALVGQCMDPQLRFMWGRWARRWQ